MRTNCSYYTLLQLIRSKVAMALVAGAVALAWSTIHAGEQIPFKATWDADITTSTLAPPLLAVSGIGEGHATHLGLMTPQSIEEVVNLETGEGVASYKFISANGDELHLEFVFLALPASPTLFAIQGTWQIMGGTGRFTDATGAGGYTGTVDFSDPNTAIGSFVALGSVSSPGFTQ